LKDSKGRIVSGLPALIELWWRLPRYRWLARLTSAPVLKQVSVGLYDHVIAPSLTRWARVRLARQSFRSPGRSEQP
jgi:predicted DCC family thiol-disulfide oxidoreductase YuxK